MTHLKKHRSTGRRLTVEKEQELISLGQIELCFRGWLFQKTSEDLGEDRIVQIYDDGNFTGLTFYLQVKSTRDLDVHRRRRGDKGVSYRFEVADINHWKGSAVPVVLMLWDTVRKCGRWIEIQSAVSHLNQTKPSWKNQKTARVLFPESNRTSRTGIAALRSVIAHRQLPVLARGRNVCLQPTFHFPKTKAGQKAKADLRKAIEEGGSVTVARKYIEKFEVSDWWARALGEWRPDSISISTTPGSGSIHVQLVATLDRATHAISLELRQVSGGTKFLHLSNEHESCPLKVHAKLPLGEPEADNRGMKLSLRIDFPGDSVALALDAARVLQTLIEGGALSMLLPNGSRLPARGFDISSFSWSAEEMRTWEKILSKLSYIESRTIKYGRFKLGQGLRNVDLPLVEQLYSICQTGECPATVNFAFTVNAPISTKEGEHLRFESGGGVIELLGVRVQLGPVTHEIQLDDAAARAFTHPRRVRGGGWRVKLKDVHAKARFPAWVPPNDGPDPEKAAEKGSGG